MSTQLSNVENSREFARTAIPLMKEFGSKIDELAREAFRLRELADAQRKSGRKPSDVINSQYRSLCRRFETLAPVVTDLARHVSQRIEHSSLDDLTRLELHLRLIELEESLQSTEEMLSVAAPRN